MPEPVLDGTAKCLVCDCAVRINIKDWNQTEAPFAICEKCSASTPQSMWRIIYLMRCQIASLGERLNSLEIDNKNLREDQARLNKAILDE